MATRYSVSLGLLLFGVVLTLTDISAGLPVSSTESPANQCHHTVLDKPGVCIPFRKCQQVTKLIAEGKANSTLIAFCKDQKGVVCCPKEETKESGAPCQRHKPNDSLLKCRLENEPPTPPENATLAVRKCYEYQTLVNQPPAIVGLLPWEPLCEERCTKNEGTPLVNGGQETVPNEFPHTALLLTKEGAAYCGGSLVAENFVLTAAHCLEHDLLTGRVNPAMVRLGEHDLNDMSGYEEEIPVKKLHPHPMFLQSDKRHSDIMLVELERAARISDRVRPACLYTESDAELRDVVISGWGGVDYVAPEKKAERLSTTLQKAPLIVVSHKDCAEAWKLVVDRPLHDTDICASGTGKGVNGTTSDACHGDSGSPIQIVNGDPSKCNYVVVGVVSKGRGCGSKTPGLYTSVSKFLPWIENIVWRCGG